ncbi:type II methylase protein [Helicobacter pylori v225d]|nr:type II methylase protein [Helicobacter pylori v225d]
MVSNTTLQKNLDAFYTHPKIARFCLDLWEWTWKVVILRYPKS